MSSKNKKAAKIREEVRVDDETFGVKVVGDGTRTLATVYYGDEDKYATRLGFGVAVRRKGDRRKDGVGRCLALSRALAEASEYYARHADRMMNGRKS